MNRKKRPITSASASCENTEPREDRISREIKENAPLLNRSGYQSGPLLIMPSEPEMHSEIKNFF